MNFALITRMLIKMLHMAMDHRGNLTLHQVLPKDSIEISHVLCGPIAETPVGEDLSMSTPTLRQILAALRDTSTNADTNKYTFEQSVLLPTIILTAAWDTVHCQEISREYGSCLDQVSQNMLIILR